MDFGDKYKFALDGSHFNFNGKYDDNIEVNRMDKEDVKTFKKILEEISEELNVVLEPYYDEEYKYWLAGMYIDESEKVTELMNKKGLTYE
jgi:small-conductance mechanosensitive channel